MREVQVLTFNSMITMEALSIRRVAVDADDDALALGFTISSIRV